MTSRLRVSLIAFGFGEYALRTAAAVAGEAKVQLLLPTVELERHRALVDSRLSLVPFVLPRLRQPWRQLRLMRSLLGTVRRFGPDVVHLQQGHLWFNLALPLLRRPLVVTVHDPRYHLGDRESQRTPQRIMDLGFRRADRVLVMADQLREATVGRGVRREIIDVVPHLPLGDEAAGSDVPEEDHQVLFFGRIWPYKGLEYLIRAEPLVSAAVPEARFVIAGQGEDLARYRGLMVHPERFEVHNRFIPDEESPGYFRRASVVALPYIDASQSGVIPMAYTFARPVVATRVGGLPELVDDGCTGLLVPPGDHRALAEALIRLLRDPVGRREMGRRGREKIRRECSAEQVATTTLAAYRAAINAHAETRRR